MVDLTQNEEGWEREFFDRLFRSLQRSDLVLEGNVPLRSQDTSSLRDLNFNCLLLFSHSQQLASFLDALCLTNPILLAILTCGNSESQSIDRILKEPSAALPFVVAPLSPLSPREAGLFYLKFFTELKLHSADHLSGKMVWFSFSKAKELLRRRRYPGRFGIRC